MTIDKSITCVVAFCNGNRGIGHKGNLPWPHLKEDYEFYNKLAATTDDPNKKNAILMGRVTFNPDLEECKDPRRVHIVVSSSMKDNPRPPGCAALVSSYNAAIDLANKPEFEHIESIKVLGGSRLYEAAIADPRCRRIVATRVFADFEADAFMPPFEHCFQKVSDPDVDDKLREHDGIQFRFEVWERIQD